ncbi:hypothetical protein GEMRC1_007853 [Eukaryota sp. GEM-RC1]
MSLDRDESGSLICPLCITVLDEIDLSRSCLCGYKICSFCLNRLQDEPNARCPACRHSLTSNLINLTPEQIQAQLAPPKPLSVPDVPCKEPSHPTPLPSNLSEMRVVTKTLVYLVGLPFLYSKRRYPTTL